MMIHQLQMVKWKASICLLFGGQSTILEAFWKQKKLASSVSCWISEGKNQFGSKYLEVGAAHGAGGQGGVGVPRTTRLGARPWMAGEGSAGDEPEVVPAWQPGDARGMHGRHGVPGRGGRRGHAPAHAGEG